MEIEKTNKKLIRSIEKELAAIHAAERKLQKKSNISAPAYKEKIEANIPAGLNAALQASFAKALELIFKHGVGIIEKSYPKNDLAANFDIHNYAIDRKGNRRELRRLKQSAEKSDFVNLSITTVEGVGLGALGIGLPDIVLFIGMILKGIYEAALCYGYRYDSSAEKYLILKMIGTALSKGDEWERGNAEVDEILCAPPFVREERIKEEIARTAKLFAAKLLVQKFIQGLPVVGMVGGAWNPVYYRRILNYVRVKYYKRYLMDKLRGAQTEKNKNFWAEDNSNDQYIG